MPRDDTQAPVGPSPRHEIADGVRPSDEIVAPTLVIFARSHGVKEQKRRPLL
jgi:hypothetical protein